MAFPPNYSQDRNNRARAKARKALEKQLKREEKSSQRQQERPPEPGEAAPAAKQEHR